MAKPLHSIAGLFKKLRQGITVPLVTGFLFISAETSSKAAPPPLPPCHAIQAAPIGTRCYESTKVGVRVRPGEGEKGFSNIFQSTEPEYVLVDVIIDNIETNGSYNVPSKELISRDGILANVSESVSRLNKVKQYRAELQARANTLTGNAYMEAKGKIDALAREESNHEMVLKSIVQAGQDAGKYRVVGSARPHKCGWMNLDTCGSWSQATVYLVKRYVGSDIEAYQRATRAAQDADATINKLASQSQYPTPMQQQCPTGTQWNGSVCVSAQAPVSGCLPNETPFVCLMRLLLTK